MYYKLNRIYSNYLFTTKINSNELIHIYCKYKDISDEILTIFIFNIV